jgi:cytochrome c biogenesis protein CcmG/thiol:disulfide interchange protein DsbE
MDAIPEPDPLAPKRGRYGLTAAVVVVAAAVVFGLIVFGPAAKNQPPSSGTGTRTATALPNTIATDGPEVVFPSDGPPIAAPAFSLVDLDGEPVTLERFAGKPLVVNFWASWCVPCREEMPAFDDVYRRLGGRVAFLGVASQDAESDAREFAKKIDVSYPLAVDEDDKMSQAYSLFGLPSTFFIDAQGRVVDSWSGELSKEELEQRIADKLGVPMPGQPSRPKPEQG